MKASSKQKFIINQGENEDVVDGLRDNSSRFPKDGFPQLFVQGDSFCQSK